VTVPERQSVQSPPDAGEAGVTVWPNVFIVGAPKSGTTALGRYLGDHPEIFVAAKELHYFGSDLAFRTRRGGPWRISRGAYASWFSGHGADRYRVDRSVFYLYSKAAATEIHAQDPSRRIIVMLRNPVDQMHAEHSEMLFQGEEDIEDFAAALEAEPDRLLGRRIPRGSQHPFGLFYRDVARYSGQLERYLSVFGRDQVHVVLYDDLVGDAAAAYGGVLRFLGVEPYDRPQFEVVNANKAVRSNLVRRTLHSTSPRLRRTGRLFVPSGAARARLRRKLHGLNTTRRPRPPLDPGLRRALEAEFDPEVRRLEVVLGRDLRAWRPSAGGPS
jgi:sulfotransferase family protein